MPQKTWLTGKIFAVGLACLSASCGGGGGGGSNFTFGPSVSGNVAAPDSGPGDANHYFPLGSTDQWFFNSSSTDVSASDPEIATASVNGTKTVLGRVATVLTQLDPLDTAPSVDNYYALTNGGVTFLGNSDSTDTVTALIVPYAQLLFPVNTGTISTIVGTNVPDGQNANGSPVTVDFKQTVANIGIETVSVPAGSFPNALKQVTTITGTAHSAGQSAPVDGSDTVWLVPGIGVVKETLTVGDPASAPTRSHELRGFTVNGLHYGFGKSTDLVSNLGVPNDTYYYPPRPRIATDGTNFLLVTEKRTGGSGSYMQQWVGILLGADGSALRTIDITSPALPPTSGSPLDAVVTFDGTNYMVVYIHDRSASQQPTTLDAARISPTGDVLSNTTVVTDQADANFGYSNLAISSNGINCLLLFNRSTGTGPKLSGVLISESSGQSNGPEFAVSGSASTLASNPAVAYDGTNFLAIWDDPGSTPPGLYGARVSPAGQVLDSPTILIADETITAPGRGCCSPLYPSIAFDGTNYLVAYSDPRNEAGDAFSTTVSAVRISTNGTLLDGSPTSPGIKVTNTLAVANSYVTTMYFSGQYWLFWNSKATSLYGARVSTTGTVTSPGTDGFFVEKLDSAYPAIAAGKNNALLLWRRYGAPSEPSLVVGGLPIYPSGP